MPGWRRRFACRRREVATMTTVSCVVILCVYSIALTWCVALPQWSQGEAEDSGVRRNHLPPIAARKLHFDPALRSPGSSDDQSAQSSVSSSKNKREDKSNTVQRHHRTLQFSQNAKDGYGWDNAGIIDANVRGNDGVGIQPKGVRTMHQKQLDAGTSRNSATSATIYLEEDSEESDGGWGGHPGQEYLEGPGARSVDTDGNSILSSGKRRLPGAIIIGVKKAGTRALLEFLRLHPDVQAPGPEPHFFDRNYNRGLDWYRSLMPVSQEGQLTIEKTPSYYITREVPKRVRIMARDMKLVVVVRDPVTRAISDYVQASSKREGKMKRFEDMALLDHRLGIVNTSWGAIRIGVYTKHLDRWFKYFPRTQFHFVSGEQLIANPAQVMKDVQEFLGLKQFITEKHFYLNATRGFPCLIKFPENNSKPHCLGKTKGRRHPDVDPRVIERLRDFYRPFNAKFYQMVGKNFGWS